MSSPFDKDDAKAIAAAIMLARKPKEEGEEPLEEDDEFLLDPLEDDLSLDEEPTNEEEPKGPSRIERIMSGRKLAGFKKTS